jgi:hypothetical protein
MYNNAPEYVSSYNRKYVPSPFGYGVDYAELKSAEEPYTTRQAWIPILEGITDHEYFV